MGQLTHNQIRSVCRAEDRKDFVTCPCCGGHLSLFGTDGFSCKGDRSNPSGCPAETVAAKLHELLDGGETRPRADEPVKSKQPKPSELPDWKGFPLDELSRLKRLDRSILKYFYDARELTRREKPVAGWAYYDETGTKLVAIKVRLSSSSHDTYFEPADPHVPFGLNHPSLRGLISKSYDLLITEGETDCVSLASWGYIVIGISGAEGWLPDYADLPIIENAKRVFICEHQDEGGKKFTSKILKTLPNAFVLRPPEGMKDFNDLHQKYVDVEIEPYLPHPMIQSIDIAIQAATLEKMARRPRAANPPPAPMRDEAFYGLAGRIVGLLEPILETDRAAILANVLGCAGVLFQRNAHLKVVATPHYVNEYFLTVGKSAVSRKGTTTDAVLEILERVEPGFKSRILHGLSTGQGLILALIKKKVDEDEDREELPEPIAQAVMVEISEFSELLAVMRRDENTLSAVLRDAWDGKPLAVMTRKDPLRVQNVGLATIAHITRRELLDKLTSTDRANGFANRFLFVSTQRSKLLPRGRMENVNSNEVVEELHKALEASKGRGEIRRNEDAEALWAGIYSQLTLRGDTIADVLLSRSEAHVVRLSLLYALLDGEPMIRRVHLEAALAVWDYCEASVRYIFGDERDADTEKILGKLDEAGPLTTGEIRRRVFHDNKTSEWVAGKMAALEGLRLVRRCEKDSRKGPFPAWESNL